MEVKRPHEVMSERGAQHGFEAVFEILQLELLEMFCHKASFDHSSKLLTLSTKLLSV